MVSDAEDVSNCESMQRADLLQITETWMDSSNPIKIDGFFFRTQKPCISRAGGVALYSNDLLTPFIVDISPLVVATGHIDIFITQIVVPLGKDIIILVIYVHQSIPSTKLLQSLQNHLVAFDKDHNIKFPIVLIG